MQPPTKKSKLPVFHLSGLRGISDSALSDILATLRDEGQLCADGTSRRNLARRVVREIQEFDTGYGPPIQKITLPGKDDHEDIEWSCCHPPAVLNWLACKSEKFGKLLRDTQRKHPCSQLNPWKLVWYCDESTPGCLLSMDLTRKSVAIYWSFSEFGYEALSKEACWMLGGILRCRTLSKVDGKMSCVFAKHLRSFFDGPHGLATAGWTIRTSMENFVVFGRLDTTIADESALRAIWSVKGSSGLKPCMLCRNVVSNRANFDLRGVDSIVDTSCDDYSKLDLHDDDSLWECADRVSAPMRKRNKEELEKILGVVASPNSILMDRPMRLHAKPASTTMYDAVHVLFVNGVFHTEVTLFLAACSSKIGLTYAQLHTFLQSWKWPKHLGNHAQQLFHARRERDNVFKAGASQCLSVYGILRDFVRRIIPQGALTKEKIFFGVVPNHRRVHENTGS